MGIVIIGMVWCTYGMRTVDTCYGIHNDSVQEYEASFPLP